jgi:hypothetical protein
MWGKQRNQQCSTSSEILFKESAKLVTRGSPWNREGSNPSIQNPIGDQPKDIEEQVTKMVKGYIKNPNCIIIAVSKATDDSANSESLKLAR